MQLLISVRTADEVPAALEGGADIVDAKEPSAGTLGMVAPGTLRAIVGALPPGIPLSVALGDPGNAADAVRFVGMVRDALDGRTGGLVKLGVLQHGDPARAVDILRAAVRAAGDELKVVAVLYADRVTASDLLDFAGAAARTGVEGLLMDTFDKHGGGLFDHFPASQVAALALQAHSAGLFLALAGNLKADDVNVAAGVGADIIGFRGAACDGGRNGIVTAARVRTLRAIIGASTTGAAAP